MGKRKPPGPDAPWHKRLWYFIWYDDSLLSWLANIVLAFILIKFIFYPALGALFGTSLPLVAVISESMEHRADFDTWWGNPELCAGDGVCPYSAGKWYYDFGITKEEFQSFPLHNGFNRGDVILLGRASNLELGDIVVFQSQKSYPIIHRIVSVRQDDQGTYYVTKGDNNPQPIVEFDLDESQVRPEQLLGKARFKVPYIGYVRLLFGELVGV